jgi:hypothetical protein
MECIFAPYDRVIMRNILAVGKCGLLWAVLAAGIFTCSNLSLVQVSAEKLVHRSDHGWICIFLYGVLAKKTAQ